MRAALFALLLVTIPGCITPSATEPVTLLATGTFMSHRGSGSVTAVPEQNVTQPAGCTLFRQGTAFAEDSCTVHNGPPSRVESPWHVSASFKGSGHPLDDPRRWSEKSIEAYDDAGQVVAVWNGSTDYHRDHARAIE